MANITICKVDTITKQFPGIMALQDVSLEIELGKVHAIVGGNGAGKSTLMNILSGVYLADRGTIVFNGKPVVFHEPSAAHLAGIAMIHQELSLVPHMTAAENVFEGRMPKNKIGFINKKKMNDDCTMFLSRLGVFHINPNTMVKDLTVSEMQLLEIAKALSLNAKMLIMDEPTSSLTNSEIEFLLNIVDKLRSEGVAVLYISHKLEEIMRIADTITVLRDGRLIATKPKVDLDENMMINLMVGYEFNKKIDRNFIKEYINRKPLLEVEHLSDIEGRVRDVSFSLYSGEVLGLTGLVGAGRTELLQSIFGVQKIKAGLIKMNGRRVHIKNPRDAINLGMGLIPEGRKLQGLFLKMPVQDNLVIVFLKKLCMLFGLINKEKTRGMAFQYVEQLGIKTPSLKQIVNNLSGGNQQKTIVARWLMNNPKILLMDEPTHGIDVGTKSEIYRIIDDLARKGVSVILLSSELPEVLSLCDRIMVMHHGELRGILTHDEADQVKIMSYTLEMADVS
jgi:ABC-type sugar transport system ATPase subunit